MGKYISYGDIKRIGKDNNLSDNDIIRIEYSGPNKMIQNGDIFEIKNENYEIIDGDRLEKDLYLKI